MEADKEMEVKFAGIVFGTCSGMDYFDDGLQFYDFKARENTYGLKDCAAFQVSTDSGKLCMFDDEGECTELKVEFRTHYIGG